MEIAELEKLRGEAWALLAECVRGKFDEKFSFETRGHSVEALARLYAAAIVVGAPHIVPPPLTGTN